MGKWTPGNWRATKHTDTRGWTVSAAGVSVASVRPRARAGEAEANARLVAAAPALYDALREAVEHVAGSRDCTHGRGFTYDFCPFNADRDRVQFDPSLADVLAQANGREPRDA